VTLATMLDRPGVTPGEVADHLDRLTATGRVAECTAISAVQQKRLWELASAEARDGGELLGSAEGETAIFAGRNSLRMFNRFEKRFARQGTTVIGYNKHSLAWLTGPGYFTVEPRSPLEGLRFDYSRVPSDSPAGWPAVVDNSGFFARPVYGGLLDEVAWVSADVMIGSAFRAGAALNSYFVLARTAH
jgi:hypothetical protein